MSNPSFTTIDSADLATVGGGVARTATPRTSTDRDAQLTLALQGITDKLKDVKNEQNNGGNNNLAVLLPLAVIASQRNRGPCFGCVGFA